MRYFEIEPPRQFEVGETPVKIRHVANVELDADELISLVSPDNRELDIVAKAWGYYVTPSLQGRLKRNGMRAALMRNVMTRQLFVVAVHQDEIESWETYMKAENQELVIWLDLLDSMPPAAK